MVKQVGIAAEDGGLTEQLLLVVEVEVLLAAELQDFAVGVGVFGGDECGASRGSVFGHETPRFVSDPTRVAKRFRPHWPDGVVLDAFGADALLLLLLSDCDLAGERSWRREDQSQGAARERLLRALPGTETSEGNAGKALKAASVKLPQLKLPLNWPPETEELQLSTPATVEGRPAALSKKSSAVTSSCFEKSRSSSTVKLLALRLCSADFCSTR
nr:Os01g0745850 [Ipomoea batatas]GMC76077.1 Os01g0745850 [Ipomoea batatas]